MLEISTSELCDDNFDMKLEVRLLCKLSTFQKTHIENDNEIFGCGYQNMRWRLRLRLLVVGIKSQD